MRHHQSRESTYAPRPENPWTVLVLAEDLDLGRRLGQELGHPDFHFAFARPEEITKFAGGLATFDLVLFHVDHERAQGLLLREILRKGQACIVVLSNVGTGAERAKWIENGADDCLSHPCESEELLARLRACIRRRQPTAKPSRMLKVGALVLSPYERTAEINGRPLTLTTCEFSLLVALAERAGQVLGREQLMEIAKGSADLAFERSIDVQVSRLRVKLQDNSRQPQIIKTVRGAGYVLVPGIPRARA
jgi:two-component system, OmpR family, response regulator